MSEYILTLSCISVFCGIIHILAPSGDGGGIKQNLRLISALAVLCVAVYPIGNFLMELKNYELDLSGLDLDVTAKAEYEQKFEEAMLEYSDESVGEICEKMLLEKFDLEDGDVNVVLFSCVENDNIKIQRADLEIYFGAITEPPDPMRESLEELLGCECRIIYK